MPLSRRSLLTALAVASGVNVEWGCAARQQPLPLYTLPIGWPDRVRGDGFWIRHGYACENTWYNPGWWHTGEDWYAIKDETAGAGIFAVAEGTVVFVGSDYPGRVVIVEHLDGLFSMYGHLDHEVAVAEGDVVEGAHQLGTVFLRTDGSAPSHLHFEIRDFLFNDRVNGRFPENGVPCGVQCAPGPGYWPIDSPDHSSEMGWRNPTHVIASSWGQAAMGGALIAVVAETAPESISLSTTPADDAEIVTEVSLRVGERLSLLDVQAAGADTTGTSAGAYDVWFQIAPDAGDPGWARALTPTTEEIGSDGSPSSLRWTFLVEQTS